MAEEIKYGELANIFLNKDKFAKYIEKETGKVKAIHPYNLQAEGKVGVMVETDNAEVLISPDGVYKSDGGLLRKDEKLTEFVKNFKPEAGTENQSVQRKSVSQLVVDEYTEHMGVIKEGEEITRVEKIHRNFEIDFDANGKKGAIVVIYDLEAKDENGINPVVLDKDSPIEDFDVEMINAKGKYEIILLGDAEDLEIPKELKNPQEFLKELIEKNNQVFGEIQKIHWERAVEVEGEIVENNEKEIWRLKDKEVEFPPRIEEDYPLVKLVKGYAELKGFNPLLAELYVKAYGTGKDNELPQEFRSEMQQFLKVLKGDLGKEIQFLNTVAKFTAKTDFHIDFERLEKLEKEENKPEPAIKRRKSKGIDLSP